MAPFPRESWRLDSFLVKLNSVAGGVASAVDAIKSSEEVLLRPRKADLESESAGAPETESATKSPDATSTKQPAPASTEVKSDPPVPTTVQVTSSKSSSDAQPSSTQNTPVVVPSSTNVPVSSRSATDEPTTDAPAPSPVSSTVPKPSVQPTVVAPSGSPSPTPTVITPSPPATQSQGIPRPGSGSTNIPVPPAPISSSNPGASQPPVVSQVPTPSTSPVAIPPAATSVFPAVSSAVVPPPSEVPSPSDGGQATGLPAISAPLPSVVLPSGTDILPLTSIGTEIAPAITPAPLPTDAPIRVGGQGSVVDGTTFTDSSITQVITTTSASVVTSDGRTFTTSVAVESTRVVSTRVPVPTAGSAALGDSNPQKTRAIVGGAIGGAIVVLVFAILAWILLHRRRRAQELKLLEAAIFKADPYTPTPARAVSSSSFGTPSPRSLSPVPSEKPYGARPGFVVTSARKKPPPFLDDPSRFVSEKQGSFDAQSWQSTSSASSSRLNPPHIHPFAVTRSPFDDPAPVLPNPFDDPTNVGSSSSNGNGQTLTRVPSLVISPATPTASKSMHSATSSVDSGNKSIHTDEFGMAM